MKTMILSLILLGATSAHAALEYPACGPLPRVMGDIQGNIHEIAGQLMSTQYAVKMEFCRAPNGRLVLAQTFISSDPAEKYGTIYDYSDSAAD